MKIPSPQDTTQIDRVKASDADEADSFDFVRVKMADHFSLVLPRKQCIVGLRVILP
jgi:hypothetical protein